ncbi:MAG TPA: hypothetical protein VIL20_03085 [Sandaracinaceae bacterium]
MRTNRSIACVVGLVGASILLSPERAEAQVYSNLGDSLAIALGISGALVVGAPTAIFTVADVVSFARDTPFHPAWAVVEIVSASFALITGGTMLALGIDPLGQGEAGLFVGSLPVLALGGFNLAHAIWSLVNHGRDASSVAVFGVFRAGGFVAAIGGAL